MRMVSFLCVVEKHWRVLQNTQYMELNKNFNAVSCEEKKEVIKQTIK